MFRRLAVVLAFTLSSCTCSSRPLPQCPGSNLQSDAANCGACGHACVSGDICRAGACVDSCAGKDLINDPQNCGGCGKVCAAGNVCKTGACIEPLELAFASPAEGAHSLPKIHVTLSTTFIGSVDSLTISLADGPAQRLTAAKTVPAVLDGSQLPDGPVVATARLTKGDRTLTATRTFIIDRTPLIPTVSLGGFWEAAAQLPLRASFAGSGAPVSVTVASDGNSTITTLSKSGAAFEASVPAATLGTGPRTLTFTATDAEGNTASVQTSALSIGLLPGSLPAYPALYDVKTPAAHGIVYAGNVNVPPNTPQPFVGELKYVAANGGTPVTISQRGCFNTASGFGGIDAAVSADGSRMIFAADPPPALAPQPIVAVPTNCTLLYATALPPGPNDPQLLSTGIANGLHRQGRTALLSLDGSLAVWTERDGTGALVRRGAVLGSGAPAPIAIPVGSTALGGPTLRGIVLAGAVVLVDDTNRTPNGGFTFLLVNRAGGATVVAGSPAAPVQAGLVRASNAEPPENSDGQVVAADGSGVVLFAPNSGYLAIRATSPTALGVCPPPAQCQTPVTMRGGKIALTNVTSTSPFASNVEMVDLQAGTVVELPGLSNGPNATNQYRPFTPPRRGQWTPVVTSAGKAGALLADGTVTALSAAGLSSPRIETFNHLFSNSSRRIFFDDPLHALITDVSGRFFTRLGGAPVALDQTSGAAAAPFLRGDRKGLVYLSTNSTRLYSYVFDAAAPVELATGTNLDAISLSWGGDETSTGDAASSKSIAFARAIGTTATGRLFVGALDTGATRQVTLADDSDSVNTDWNRYGVTADDSAVWWYSANGHLYAQAPGGGPNADFGVVDPNTLFALQGGTFLFAVSGDVPQLAWATLAQPAPKLLTGSSISSSLVAEDHASIVFGDDASTWWLSKAGISMLSPSALAVVANKPGAPTSTIQSDDGSIFYVSYGADAPPPLLLEGPGPWDGLTTQFQAAPVANESGILPGAPAPWDPQGAARRTTFTYVARAPSARIGVYVVESVDQLYLQSLARPVGAAPGR